MNAIVQFRARDQKDPETTLLIAVMESCSESLAIIDGGRVLHANRAFAQTFGYLDSSDVQGRIFAELVPEFEFPFSRSREDVATKPASSSGPSTRECSAVRKDGRQMCLRVASAAFYLDQRELLVISLRLLPERKPEGILLLESQQESQKLEAQKLEAMGRLVGGVAHDFNNLLTGIFLYCDLLLAALENGNPLRAYVEEIRKAGGHSADLIQQLLTVARPQVAGSGAASWNEAVSDMRNLLSRLLGENVELVTELGRDAAPVHMDPAQMRQLVLNLVLNARDAMPQGGRVTLAVRNCLACGTDSGHSEPPATNTVEFTVTDTGCGMDAGTRTHLFESFFTTKPPGQGSGLGLATVYRIVQKENGSIHVDSEPGKGTRVTVRLPCASPVQDQFMPVPQI